jgi:hypothetical protein
MTPEDRAVIETWSRELKEQVRISIAATHDSRSSQISDFCGTLSALAPLVMIVKADPEDDRLPFIRIQKQIKYRAIPQGRELMPFLISVSGSEKGAIEKDGADAEILERIQMPGLLKIYVTIHCPYCPQVVSVLCALAQRSEKIFVEIIDGDMFSELARQDHIRSVPTVILDDQFRWTGSINVSEIINMMISRDPAEAGVHALRSILEAGNASDLARMMVQSRKIYPAFIELLIHPKWPVRLGAMAAFEYLDEMRPELAEDARFKLWESFEPVDDSVKGDIAYLLGGSHHPLIQTYLESVTCGDYAEEVREAAREALL